jgi:predicted flap endonuclease-1-like 5' DNA nuclease
MDMIVTANLWALLGITLLAGFLFGLFVSNAGKYRKQWRAEVRERIRVEHERDDLMKERDRVVAERDARVMELQRNRATTTAPLPVGAAPTPDARDRLSAIAGLDPQDEIRLNEAGYYRYDQIAGLSSRDDRALEDALGRDRGSIRAEQWREQAKMLAAGRSDDHLRQYGASHRAV